MEVGESISRWGGGGCLMSREITWVHSVKQEREPPWTEGRHGAEAEARPRVS